MAPKGVVHVADDFASMSTRFAPVENMVSSPGLKRVADQIGVAAKKEAMKAELADIGPERGFSGWTMSAGKSGGRKAMPLDTRYEHVRPGEILFHPTKRAAGPWTVAEFGRNTAAGPMMVGPKLTKTGRVSKAKRKRYNGKTEGKGTATDALKLIDRRTTKIVQSHVSVSIRSLLG